MSDKPSRPAAPPTERVDPPLYLARYREREARRANGETQRTAPTDDGDVASGDQDRAEKPNDDSGTPLYLRRFRERPVAKNGNEDVVPLWQRTSLELQRALTEENRNKEISPPPVAAKALANDVYLIRHGETQGYSTDSGLTPAGAWQCHTYGHTLAKRIKSGETVVLRHARTSRATETAEQIHRGLLDGLAMFEKDITIVEPAPMDEFRNFQFAAPDGLKDVTAAFRQYYAMLEGFERSATGDRPLWLVEMDRFWRTQQGGADPIQHWLTIPMIHFEPPSMCVRRFWAGINALTAEFPGARLAIATHSGPIRAFAVAALGYDPGEPYNTEHVRTKIYDGLVDASVAYRNRVQDIKVPSIGDLPQWQVIDRWKGFEDDQQKEV